MKIFAKLIFRVRGIPHNATLSDLRRTLCPDDPKTTIRATFSPSPYDRNRKTALVQFDPRHPEYLDIVVAGATKNHQMEMLMDQQPDFCADIVVDTEFNGLTQMYPTPPGVKINADVIAVTGLTGHAFGSWRGKGALGRMWLREFLAVDLPNCRTMTYGYDSKLLSKGVHEVMSYKIRLLEELKMARTSDEERNRPIIFIGHSFGGIIIEQALVHSSLATSDPALNAISASTHAIMFFGTPHRCFPVDDIIKIIDPPANAERVSLVQSINSMSGVDLERFGRFVAEARIPVISFYERLESRKDIKGDTGCERSDRNVTSVDSEPSLLNLEGVREIKVPLEVDHTGIVKFDSVEDEAYRSVRYYLQDFESEIINAEQEMKKKKEARAANPGIVAPIQPKMLNDVPVPMMMVPYKETMQRAKDENERPKTQPKANPSTTEDDLAGIFCAIKQAVNDSDMTVIKQLIIDGVDLNYPHGNDGWTPLEHAVNQSHEPMVRLLLQGGADPDYEGRAHWTPLLRAISNSHLHLASLLIKGGADPKKHHIDGWTPLQWAAKKGFEPMVLMLIERGADPDHESRSHWTPFLRALDSGHTDIAKLLIESGANPSKYHGDGWTPLQWAAKKGSEVMVKMLVERGANPDHESTSHWTPLLRAIDCGHIHIAKLLIDKGANPNKHHEDGWTPLQWAAKKGSEVMVKMLIERGADPDHESRSHWTPFLRALDSGHTDIAKLLIESGANPSKYHGDGWTPLQWAAKKGSEVMVKMLVERGANPDHESTSHWTPLLRAIDCGHIHVANLLIDKGADPNKNHQDGWTPLQWAAKKGSEVMVKMLIERGANLDSQSSTYWTPLSRAIDSNHLTVSRLLIENGADPDLHHSDGWTPLHFAARRGSEEMVKMLLEKGADPDYESSTHWTPLSRAVNHSQLHIARLLIKSGARADKHYRDGWTPMQYAARSGSEPILRLLISEAPSEVDYESPTHWTPLLRAVDNGHGHIVKFLIENGADPRRRYGDGYTPLSYAEKKGYEPMKKLLLMY